jgi:hypothetical protein
MTQIECLEKLKRKGKVDFTQQNFSQHVARGVIPCKIKNGRKSYKYKDVLEALRKAGLLNV